MIAIEPTAGGGTIGKVRSSPIALPTPPASATSTVDHNMELEQTANISDSAELALNGAQRDAGSLPQGAKLGEALNVSVEPGAQSPSAHIHANDLPEKGEILPPWQPFNNIPGIWLLNEGSDGANVFEHSFQVTKEMALKWHLPLIGDFVNPRPEKAGSHFTLIRKSLPAASWKLKCVSLEAMNAVRHTLEKPDTVGELVHELVRLQSCWPSEGKLLIEVNPGHDLGKTFYPKHLVNKILVISVQNMTKCL